MGAREPQRERAGAAEQVRDPFRIPERALGKLGEPRFSRFGRLQEAAGRQSRHSVAERRRAAARRSMTISP